MGNGNGKEHPDSEAFNKREGSRGTGTREGIAIYIRWSENRRAKSKRERQENPERKREVVKKRKNKKGKSDRETRDKK